MSHQLFRINETKYAYYVEGGNFAIVEEDDNGHYVSPITAIDNGILVRFTKMPTMPTSEDSTLPVDPELALSLIDYVKAKFFEKNGEYDKRNFHMREFKRRVFEYQKNRFGGAKISMPLANYAIR